MSFNIPFEIGFVGSRFVVGSLSQHVGGAGVDIAWL